MTNEFTVSDATRRKKTALYGAIQNLLDDFTMSLPGKHSGIEAESIVAGVLVNIAWHRAATARKFEGGVPNPLLFIDLARGVTEQDLSGVAVRLLTATVTDGKVKTVTDKLRLLREKP